MVVICVLGGELGPHAALEATACADGPNRDPESTVAESYKYDACVDAHRRFGPCVDAGYECSTHMRKHDPIPAAHQAALGSAVWALGLGEERFGSVEYLLMTRRQFRLGGVLSNESVLSSAGKLGRLFDLEARERVGDAIDIPYVQQLRGEKVLR